MYLLNMFLVYSIIGFIFEHIVYFFIKKKGKSGILIGPYTPIYGIGAIIIFSIYKIVSFIFTSFHLKLIIFVLSVAIIITFIEFVSGIFIEKTFGVIFWDYSNKKYSYGHYICLSISITWSLLALLLIYIINPLLHNFIISINGTITFYFYMLFIIDILLTIISKTKFKKYLIKI